MTHYGSAHGHQTAATPVPWLPHGAADDPAASYHVDQEITTSHEANNRFPHLLLPPPQSTAQER